jgi:hypothetical protein
MQNQWVIWLLGGLLCAAAMAALGVRWGPNARLRRRRRKSHSQVISKANRPSVKFSVRPPKE